MLEILPLVSGAEITGATISSSAFKLVFQLLLGFVALVGIATLFFGTRFFIGAYRKRKNYKINALIINTDGTWYSKKIGKFRTADNIDKMCFQGSNETMSVINPAHIRAKQVMLYRYGIGQYAVIPPKMWENINLKKFNIDLINMQMKNFAFLEQRAAVSRWAYIKDLLQRWAPYLTLLVVAVACGVIVWFLMRLGYNIFNDAISARTIDCRTLLGQTTPTVGD